MSGRGKPLKRLYLYLYLYLASRMIFFTSRLYAAYRAPYCWIKNVSSNWALRRNLSARARPRPARAAFLWPWPCPQSPAEAPCRWVAHDGIRPPLREGVVLLDLDRGAPILSTRAACPNAEGQPHERERKPQIADAR
jgi:hypothetical protein